MSDMIWKPHVTVAALIERDGRFLMVREQADGEIAYNQPAGHLEAGESLIEAMIREAREESAWRVEPEALVGIYQWPNPDKGITYLRFAFSARAVEHFPDEPLDTGILAAEWMDLDAIAACAQQHRGPQVQHCIDDYLKGIRLPLDSIKDFA